MPKLSATHRSRRSGTDRAFRRSITFLASAGWLVMSPSTPIEIIRDIVTGSSTVQDVELLSRSFAPFDQSDRDLSGVYRNEIGVEFRQVTDGSRGENSGSQAVAQSPHAFYDRQLKRHYGDLVVIADSSASRATRSSRSKLCP